MADFTATSADTLTAAQLDAMATAGHRSGLTVPPSPPAPAARGSVPLTRPPSAPPTAQLGRSPEPRVGCPGRHPDLTPWAQPQVAAGL